MTTLGRSFSRRLFTLAFVALGSFGIAVAQAPPAAQAAPAAPAAAPVVPRTLDVPDGALFAAGKAPEVEVLYTGDVIGFIEPCG